MKAPLLLLVSLQSGWVRFYCKAPIFTLQLRVLDTCAAFTSPSSSLSARIFRGACSAPGNYEFIPASKVNRTLIDSVVSDRDIKVRMIEPVRIEQQGQMNMQFRLLNAPIVKKASKSERRKSTMTSHGYVHLLATYKGQDPVVSALFENSDGQSVAQWIIRQPELSALVLKYIVTISPTVSPSQRSIKIVADYKKGAKSVQSYTKDVFFPPNP